MQVIVTTEELGAIRPRLERWCNEARDLDDDGFRQALSDTLSDSLVRSINRLKLPEPIEEGLFRAAVRRHLVDVRVERPSVKCLICGRDVHVGDAIYGLIGIDGTAMRGWVCRPGLGCIDDPEHVWEDGENAERGTVRT